MGDSDLLHIIFDSFSDLAVFIFDAEFRYVSVMGGLPELCSVQFEGKTFYELCPPELIKEYEGYYKQAIKGEKGFPNNYYNLETKKHYKTVFLPYVKTQHNMGIIVIRDITEYIRLSSKERHIKSDAFVSAANRFGAELNRTALEIFQLAHNIYRKTGSSDAMEVQEKAQKQLTELRDLHLISGSFHPNFSRESLNYLIKTRAAEFDIPVYGVDIDVLVDIGSFNRALDYLLENIRNYGVEGTGIISIGVDKGIPVMEISNKINGGYTGSALPFFSPYGGRGLGLNIIHAIVEKNGGTMQVSAEDGLFKVRITLKA